MQVFVRVVPLVALAAAAAPRRAASTSPCRRSSPRCPLVRDGRLVALGVTSAERSALLPDGPTVAEAGVPDYEYEGWFGFLAPAKTSAHVIEKIGARCGASRNCPTSRRRSRPWAAVRGPARPRSWPS